MLIYQLTIPYEIEQEIRYYSLLFKKIPTKEKVVEVLVNLIEEINEDIDKYPSVDCLSTIREYWKSKDGIGTKGQFVYGGKTYSIFLAMKEVY